MNEVTIKDLIGKTIVSIGNSGADLNFYCKDGSEYLMYHIQDCCESVYIEDICGDLEDLIGTPIILAEEASSSDENPKGIEDDEALGYQEESFTWTFYRLATKKGFVIVRWYGGSNGYYSESVDFEQIKEGGINE